MRVQNPNFARANTLDFVRAVAELEDVAGEAFNREIFIQGANKNFGRFENYTIVTRVRNRAAICDRRQARAASATDAPVHRIVMQISSAASTSCRESFRKHAHHFIEFFTLQILEWIRTRDHLKQRIFRPFHRRGRRDDLLRENIEWLLGNFQMIQFAAPYRIDQRRAFD